MVTRSPLACNNFASEAEIIPFPNDEVTPPVTNTYLDISLVLVLKILLARQYNIIQHLLRRTLVLRQFYSAINFREISQPLLLTNGRNKSGRSCKTKRNFRY